MKTVFFVRQEEAATARTIEKTLLSLPKESGILFVSVSVLSIGEQDTRKVNYRVVVGCSRSREIELVAFLVKSHLQQEMKDLKDFIVEVHRGMDRSLQDA